MTAPLVVPAQPRSGASPDPTVRAIQVAAARSGVDFGFMLAQAALESGFDPEAQAPTSSARGLYQFTDATWLAMVRDHGAEVGLGAEAAHIGTTADGRPVVDDAAARRRILALRDDPRLSAELAARLAKDNRRALETAGGVGAVGATELYLAHFLGAGQATKFLARLTATPDADAANLFPVEAKANQDVFHDASGRSRSLAEVYDRFEARLSAAVRDIDVASGTLTAMVTRSVPGPSAMPARPSWQPGHRYAAPLDPLVVLVLASLDAPAPADIKRAEPAARG
ncbi:MAG: transglycosylase SLT domain-containing protein [Alphaproteobacteria bacterium]